MSAVRRTDGRLTVALVSEVFWQPDGVVRLGQRLDEAARRGADLALLPELPLHPWRPATKDAVDDDAEPMGGPRMTAQAEAARTAKIGLVGGIIHRDAIRAADEPRPRLRRGRGGGLDLREAPSPRGARLLGDEPLRTRVRRSRGRSTPSGCPSASRSAPTRTDRRARTCSVRSARRRSSSRARPRRRPTSAGRSCSGPTPDLGRVRPVREPAGSRGRGPDRRAVGGGGSRAATPWSRRPTAWRSSPSSARTSPGPGWRIPATCPVWARLYGEAWGEVAASAPRPGGRGGSAAYSVEDERALGQQLGAAVDAHT